MRSSEISNIPSIPIDQAPSSSPTEDVVSAVVSAASPTLARAREYAALIGELVSSSRFVAQATNFGSDVLDTARDLVAAIGLIDPAAEVFQVNAEPEES